MTRTLVDSLVTEKTLAMINGNNNADLVDLIEQDVPQIKNVCAKVSVQLSDRLDNTLGLLGISKRRFIEAALIDALNKASQIMDEEGLHEALSFDPEDQENQDK